SDLMPPGPGAKVPFDETGDPDQRTQPEWLRARNAHRKASRDLEAQRQRIAAQGEDPDKYLPKTIPPFEEPKLTSAEEHDAWRAEGRERAARMRAEAEEARKKAEAEARRTF